MSLQVKVKVANLPAAGDLTGDELLYMEQDSNPVKVTPTQLSTISSAIPASRTGTKVELNAMVAASSLLTGQLYKCTDATASDVDIILLAIDVNKFSVWVEKADDTENFYLYDFASDTMKGKIGLNTLLIGTDTPTGDPNFSKFEIQYNQIPGFSDTILYLNDQSTVVRTFDGIDARTTLERSRGTIDTPLPVQSGDVIGGFHITARNSLDAFESVFIIRTTATDAEESGFFPSQVVFYNRKKNGGHSTLGDEFMRVDQNLILSVQGAFRSARLTTTERDALVGLIGGEQIFNTTTNKHQGYDGSVWNDMY